MNTGALTHYTYTARENLEHSSSVKEQYVSNSQPRLHFQVSLVIHKESKLDHRLSPLWVPRIPSPSKMRSVKNVVRILQTRYATYKLDSSDPTVYDRQNGSKHRFRLPQRLPCGIKWNSGRQFLNAFFFDRLKSQETAKDKKNTCLS